MYTKEKEEGVSILYFFTFNEESNTLDETKIGILSSKRNQCSGYVQKEAAVIPIILPFTMGPLTSLSI